MLNEILEKYGLKYEDLNAEERETLNVLVQAVQQSQLTLDKVKDSISAMKISVENEVTKTTHNSKQDIFLKARLRNYMLLEAVLSSPKRAKEQLDRALASLTSKIKI